MDWNGNLIWECPYGITIDGFTVRLQLGISHIILQFTPYYTNDRLSEQLTGKGFCYDCRHPGLFVDSYQDYVLKNRDYDIQMRRIQSEKQELQSLFSVAENVGFGMAFGGPVGATAAGIGGLIEATSTWVTNSVYDPQIQRQYDRLYSRVTDQISLVGDSVTNLLFEYPMYVYTLIMDVSSQNTMKNDISINGYVCDETINNLSTIFTNNIISDTYLNIDIKPVFQADNVVVEGACNVIGKQQVVRRLQNGVEFINTTQPSPSPAESQNYTLRNIDDNHILSATFTLNE